MPLTGNQSLAERAPRSNRRPRSVHRFSVNACTGTDRGWDAGQRESHSHAARYAPAYGVRELAPAIR